MWELCRKAWSCFGKACGFLFFLWGGVQNLRVGPKVHQTWELCVYLFPKAQTEVIGESKEARCPCGVLKWPRCLDVDSWHRPFIWGAGAPWPMSPGYPESGSDSLSQRPRWQALFITSGAVVIRRLRPQRSVHCCACAAEHFVVYRARINLSQELHFLFNNYLSEYSVFPRIQGNATVERQKLYSP